MQVDVARQIGQSLKCSLNCMDRWPIPPSISKTSGCFCILPEALVLTEWTSEQRVIRGPRPAVYPISFSYR